MLVRPFALLVMNRRQTAIPMLLTFLLLMRCALLHVALLGQFVPRTDPLPPISCYLPTYLTLGYLLALLTFVVHSSSLACS